jgi:hypothetical protein
MEGAIAPSIHRLLLELSTYDDRLAVVNFIIESYHDWNISVKTKSALSSVQEHLLLSSNYFALSLFSPSKGTSEYTFHGRFLITEQSNKQLVNYSISQKSSSSRLRKQGYLYAS